MLPTAGERDHVTFVLVVLVSDGVNCTVPEATTDVLLGLRLIVTAGCTESEE